MWTDNPAADFDRYDAKMEDALSQLPRCSICGHPIQDDFLYEINDELVCEECLNENFRKHTEDYTDF